MLYRLTQFKWLQNRIFKYSLLVFAGVINIYAFAPYNVALSLLLSFFILFWVLEYSTRGISNLHLVLVGFIYGIAFFATQIYWIFYTTHFIIGMPIWLSLFANICFSIFLSTYIALAIVVYVKLRRSNQLFNYLALFPSVWVLCEWIRGWFFGGYSWSDIGYTQVNNPLFHGLFAVIGEYGVSWISLSFIGALYLIFQYVLFMKDKMLLFKDCRFAIIYITIVCIVAFMLEDIHYTHPYTNPITVGLIQGNISVDSKWQDPSDTLAMYAQAVKNTKADIVILPETAITQFAAALPHRYLDNLEAMAHANAANLIIGMPVITDKIGHYVNTAMILTNPHHPYYAKHHLVPFGEYIPLKGLLGYFYKYFQLPMVDFSAGSVQQEPLVIGNQKVALNICFENGFAHELISAAKHSTVMVNLSDMAWYGTTVAMNQHLQISQARALENQRYFIQDTNTSITAIIKPNGEIQSQLPVFTRQVLRDQVQGMFGITPYEIVGNWPVIMLACLILLISLI